jgi:2-C-methyl-D-erythritol 4-phosphate cytidylyltransferase/2-C-methyl-D-erythritol 2,4-cyclodiphosphate synthase
MFVTAIIAAGGRGQRFGGTQPKQLIAIAGEPILARSVHAFVTHPAVGEVIVALPQEFVDDPPAYLRAPGVRIVAGGARRQDSVANAFAAASPASDVIVIHDAARPFASSALIARTIAAASESGAAVAAVASRDTVKVVGQGPAEAGHYVRETIPRERVYLAQTPQAFRRDVLADALRLTDDATDEAALAERAGHRVRVVVGEATNIKITTPEDLSMAEAILRSEDRGMRNESSDRSAIRNPQSAVSKPARTGRAGTGYDLHRLVEGRPLILGGVRIPSDRGAIGHSDADVVCHAVTDAILGALSLGDIGRHFPDTDARWKGANSLDLLARAVAIADEHGYEIGNVDVTVVLERPKIKDHVDAMRANLAQALGVDAARVSVKGKTNEGVDAVGRGEAVAAHAIALVRSRV